MIVGALLVRNEAADDRYLGRALENAAQFTDKLVVVDDGSEDDTASVCTSFGAEVHTIDSDGFWGGEGERNPRLLLWRMASAAAGPDGWIYVADADHELIGINPEDFKQLTISQQVNAWACPLYDCWDSDKQMRTDGYWKAHLNPRVWFVKAFPTPDFEPEWGDRQIHVGHLPANYPAVVGLMPPGAAIRHLGYVKPEHRKSKLAKYLQLAD